MRVLMIVALALAMFGCATGSEVKWNDPVKQAKWDKDVPQCKYEAEMGSKAAAAGATGAIEIAYRQASARNELLILCMEARGWKRGG